MPEVVFPALVMITGILTAGGVLILRPISGRVGRLVEAMTEDRRRPPALPDTGPLLERIAHLEARLARVEERQDFSEALLEPVPDGPARLSEPA